MECSVTRKKRLSKKLGDRKFLSPEIERDKMKIPFEVLTENDYKEIAEELKTLSTLQLITFEVEARQHQNANRLQNLATAERRRRIDANSSTQPVSATRVVYGSNEEERGILVNGQGEVIAFQG